MSRKSRYSLETKLIAIQDYQNGLKSAAGIAADLSMNVSQVRNWIHSYEHHGVDAIADHERNKAYRKGEKLEAVAAYLLGQESLQEICLSRGISSSSQLHDWIKKYNGHEEIRDYDPKGDVYMTKGRATTIVERIEIVNWCMAHEKSYKLAAERYGVSYGQVYAWVAKYLQQGEAGLTDSRGHRKPEETLTLEERQAREIKLLKAETERLKLEIELRKKVQEIERRLYSERYGKKRNT